MLWKSCTQYASKFGKLSSVHRTGKGQFFIQIPKKGNAKECSNYHTIALISHTSKVMLKILQTRCQQYVNHKFPDVQAGFKKGRELEMKLPTSAASSKKQESFRKPSAAAAAKSLQLCPTLCDPIDSSSPPGSPIPGILQARTLEWVAISFSSAWKWKVKVKSLSRVWRSATPWTVAFQAPLSMGFSRQEYWSGVPLPSPSAC